jgi:hypothetical protein
MRNTSKLAKEKSLIFGDLNTKNLSQAVTDSIKVLRFMSTRW